MNKFVFRPQVGMKTDNSYLHGVGNIDTHSKVGVIEHVGIDYFVLRVEEYGPLFVTKDSYWAIEEEDFKDKED